MSDEPEADDLTGEAEDLTGAADADDASEEPTPPMEDADVDFSADAGDLTGAAGGETTQTDILAREDEMLPRTSGRQSAFMGVPIDVTVAIGKARPLVSELVKLRRDSVLTLDSKIEDPVELFIGDRLIARGELQEMDDETGQLGVRLTEVADLSGGV